MTPLDLTWMPDLDIDAHSGDGPGMPPSGFLMNPWTNDGALRNIIRMLSLWDVCRKPHGLPR